VADKRYLNDEYAEIANRLIHERPELAYIKNSNVSIAYLGSNSRKKQGNMFVCGQCEKVADKYKWSVPADFTITVFEPNVREFDETQMEALMFHELLHVGIFKREDGKEIYSCNEHDLTDFKIIIDLYGTNWNERK